MNEGDHNFTTTIFKIGLPKQRSGMKNTLGSQTISLTKN